MARVAAAAALLLAMLVAAPGLVGAPAPPAPAPLEGVPTSVPVPPGPGLALVRDAVRDLVGNRTVPAAENLTGEDLDREEVDVLLHVRVANAELDLAGIVLGGGKVQLDVDAEASVAFRAVAIARLEEAMERVTGAEDVRLAHRFGVNSSAYVVTAEEVRRLGGEAVLEAFQQAETEALAAYVEESLPGMKVLATRMAWSNTEPHTPGAGALERLEDDGRPALRVRDPPLVLDAAMRLQYLDRQSLGDLLGGAGHGGAGGGSGGASGGDASGGSGEQGGGGDAAEARAAAVREAQTLPPWERSAFALLGIAQVLEADVPPGWRVQVRLAVPEGFSIVDATNELRVSPDRREASFVLDGASADRPLSSASVLTMSSRSMVVSLLLALVLVAGLALRFLVEPVARMALRRGAGQDAPRRAAPRRAAPAPRRPPQAAWPRTRS